MDEQIASVARREPVGVRGWLLLLVSGPDSLQSINDYCQSEFFLSAS